jgi:glucosyl-3-phosphoglycerate synthase
MTFIELQGGAMSDFAQKHTRICTFYLLNDQNPQMEFELLQFSKWKKAVLIIPLLASEYTLSENRPVFENIAS